MENYDAIGRYREMDKGQVLDASGTLLMDDDSEVVFSDFLDLVDQLTERSELYECFTEQFVRYATGRSPAQTDACVAQQINDAFVASEYRFDALVEAIVGSPLFIQRRNEDIEAQKRNVTPHDL